MDTDNNKKQSQQDINSDSSEFERQAAFRRPLAVFIVFFIILGSIFLAFHNIIYILKSNSMFYYGELANQPVLYTKDDGIYIHKLGEDNSYHITEKTPEKSQSSKDGKRIFILCGKNLLYINFNDMNYSDIRSSVHTIDQNVDNFICSRDGRYVSYLKGHSLYGYKAGEEPFLIANSVFGDFFINDTDGNIIYTVYNSDLCVFNINQRSVIRTNNVDYYEFKNGASNKVYYLSRNKLYYRENNNTPEFIAGNMSNMFSAGDGIFTLSVKANDVRNLYKIDNKKARLIEKYVSDITDDFGSSVIYKHKSKNGLETRLLNSSGNTFRLFGETSAASNYTVSKDGTSLFAILDYHTGENVLMNFTLNNKGINERTIVAENVYSYILLENGNTVYITNHGAYIYTKGKSLLLSTFNIHDVIMTEDSIYVTETADDSNFNILRVKNGSVQFMVENASNEFDYLTASDIIYIQNGNLYFKHGNEDSKLIDNNAKSILKTTKYN